MVSIFALSVCESFRDSSIIESIYRVILLLYHPHFGSDSQNRYQKNNPIKSIYCGRVYFFCTMSKVCIVLFQTMQKK